MNFVSVGTFDGVHLGHKHLLEDLALEARRHGMKSMAVYFPIPPKAVLSGEDEMSMITLPEERERLIRSCGVDYARPLEFTKEFAKTGHKTFFNTLIKDYGMGGFLAGRDFAFGHDRHGHVEFLRRECARHNIPLSVLSFVKSQRHKVSSSVIRTLLRYGHVEQAAEQLGRPHSVSGRVIKGMGLGRKLGFPTANLDTGIYKILPRGVYAVKASLDGRLLRGVASIGFRPTVNTIYDRIPLVEVHLLDFSEMIYRRTLEIEFISKLRDEERFPSVDALKTAIGRDVDEVRRRAEAFVL